MRRPDFRANDACRTSRRHQTRRRTGQGLGTGPLIGRHVWAEGLVTFRFDVDLPAFRPGQFVNLALPVRGRWVKRTYSVASAPGEKGEFYVVLVPEGALTPPMFRLALGETIAIQLRPQGVFTLDSVPDADVLWMICTGTGLAPYISMLRTEEPWERFGHIVLVHGVRHQTDLSYQEELRRRSAAHGGRLTWVAAVTREPGLHGVVHGRIPAALRDGRIERFAGRRVDTTSQVLVCGNPAMIKDLTVVLKERGLRRNRPRKPGQITTERYW